MSITYLHARRHIVIPTLRQLTIALNEPRLSTPDSVELVLGTIAHESLGGRYFHQIRGPAMGITQVEPATCRSFFHNYLRYRPEMLAVVMSFAPEHLRNEKSVKVEALYIPQFAVVICRLLYWRVPHKIPSTLYGRARYWDDHYNRNPEKGFAFQFCDDYERWKKGHDL